MKLSLTKLLFTPLIAAGLFGIYYPKFYGAENIVDKNPNQHLLVAELNRSHDKNYTTGLKGYENHITRRRGNGYLYNLPYSDLFTTRSGNQIKGNVREGLERIDIIKDYSIQLKTPCGSGTGWFLDYILPKGTQTYPTKWFIATNAHVIEDMSFSDNPYQQSLPKKKGEGCRIPQQAHTPVALLKEKPNANAKIKDSYPEFWDQLRNRGTTHKHIQRVNELSGSEDKQADLLYFIDLNPKLLYAPINFLGQEVRHLGYQLSRPNYYKDFAVLEIDFKTENAAKALTRNFYEKYDYNTGNQRSKSLNFFEDELIYKKTGDQLIGDNEDYFVAGYASNGHTKNESTGNYSYRRGTASKLADIGSHRYSLKNKYNQELVGHVNVGLLDDEYTINKTTLRWGGLNHNDWGYNYVINNSHLSSGASGSITTDIRGNVLGLYRMHDGKNKHGFIEPIRSKGIYKNGKILYPAYDLIEGTESQISSYKSQIQKYYLINGEETSLSKYRNWNY